MGRAGLLAALFCIGVSWGLTVVLAKIAVSTGHQPLGLIFWELLISIALLGGFLAFQKKGFKITPQRIVLFAIVGLMGTVLPGAFSYRAAAELPAGVMAIVIALVPLCALPVAIIMGLEKPNLKRFAGVLLGALSVVLIIGPDNALPDPSKVFYVLIALVAPFCYGFEGNYVSWKGTHGLNAIQTLFGAAIVAVVFSFPLAVVTDEWVDIFIPWGAAEWALVALSVLHIGAYSGYIWLVGQAGSIFAAQVAYLVTISGVMWSIAILGEGYSAWLWAALVTLLVCVSLVLPKPSSDVVQ